MISGVTGVVRGTLSYDYKVTYQKEDVTVGDMNGTVDGSSQMSAEFVYKDGNYQLRYSESGKYLVQGIAINGLAVTDKVF